MFTIYKVVAYAFFGAFGLFFTAITTGDSYRKHEEQYISASSETGLAKIATKKKSLTRTENPSLNLRQGKVRYLETKEQTFEEKMLAKGQEYKPLKATRSRLEEDISQSSTKPEIMEMKIREIEQSERKTPYMAKFDKLQARINSAIALSSKYQEATDKTQSELNKILEAGNPEAQNKKEGRRSYTEPRAFRDHRETIRRRYGVENANSKHTKILRELAGLRSALEKKASKVRSLEVTLAQRDACYQQQIAEKEDKSQERLRDMLARFRRAQGSMQKRYSTNKWMRVVAAKGNKSSAHKEFLKAENKSSWWGYNTLKGRPKISLVKIFALKEAYDTLRVRLHALKKERDSLQSEGRALMEVYDRMQLEYRCLEERLDASQLAFDNQQKLERNNLKRTIKDVKGVINARDQKIVELEAALQKKAEELNQSQLEKVSAYSAIKAEKGKTEELGKELSSHESNVFSLLEIYSATDEGSEAASEHEGEDSVMHGVPLIEENEDMPDVPMSRPSASICANLISGFELSGPSRDEAFQMPTLSSPGCAILNTTVFNPTFGGPPPDIFGAVDAPTFGLQVVTAFGSAAGAAAPPEASPAPPTSLGHSYSLDPPFTPALPTPTSHTFSTSFTSSLDPALPAVHNSMIPSTPPAPPIPNAHLLSFGPLISAPRILPSTTASNAPSPTFDTPPPPASIAPKTAVGDCASAEEPRLSPRLHTIDNAKCSTTAETSLLIGPRQSPRQRQTAAPRPPRATLPAMPAALIDPSRSKRVTPDEAKDFVEELIDAYEAKLLGNKDLSKFYSENRRVVREGLDFDTITCVEQVGITIMEILARSYNYICECLERTFTEGDLASRSFNYKKWQRTSAIEEKLQSILRKLNNDFWYSEGLDTKAINLEMTKANIAFLAALEEKKAEMDDIPLPE